MDSHYKATSVTELHLRLLFTPQCGNINADSSYFNLCIYLFSLVLLSIFICYKFPEAVKLLARSGSVCLWVGQHAELCGTRTSHSFRAARTQKAQETGHRGAFFWYSQMLQLSRDAGRDGGAAERRAPTEGRQTTAGTETAGRSLCPRSLSMRHQPRLAHINTLILLPSRVQNGKNVVRSGTHRSENGPQNHQPSFCMKLDAHVFRPRVT